MGSQLIHITVSKIISIGSPFTILKIFLSSKNKSKMKIKLVFLLAFSIFYNSLSQIEPSTTGYTCTPNQTTSPCQAYAFYRASAPDFLDLASIADLFSLSRPMISNPSNISSPTSPLIPDQSLFVPLTCSCNSINATYSLSYANLTYTIKKGDTFYLVSSNNYQNLTTYQSVQVVNPTLVPTDLQIGSNVIFPIFCKCPNLNRTQNQNPNRTSFFISYVLQPSDTITSIASRFGSSSDSIIENNGNNIRTFQTVFVPVERLPILDQPITAVPPPGPPPKKSDQKGVVIGLGIGLGLCGVLLALVVGLWSYREYLWRKMRGKGSGVEFEGKRKMELKEMEENLMADVSDCLDKYRVVGIQELIQATDGFDEKCLIEGSVYKGCINGEFYAIKKMKWDACEELKILQKVNHGNLVKLEGFCIDPKDLHCYLIYEYVENGSLHSWLHSNKPQKLSWKARLRIAIDVANGLQYIHEHTIPRVVHKDIKTSNILLDANMRAKIANFGLAKSGCNAITMHIVGTQGYIAPEYLSDGVVSTRMDVFSFGVVLLELVSGREAIDEDGNVLWASAGGILEGREEEKVKTVKKWMDGFLVKESCSMESVINVMNIGVACLNKDPLRRPSMVEIVYSLCKSDDDVFFDVSQDGFSPRYVVAR